MSLTDSPPQSNARAGPPVGLWLRFSPALAVVALLAYAAEASEFFSVFGTGLMVAAAATLVGTTVGFLFGLPRMVERPDSTGIMATNSNLDQVSDWLTKILVALGLVQLGRFADGLQGLAESLAPGLGDRADSEIFALGLIVYCLADGFLLGYLWTRLELSPRLKAAAEDLAMAKAVLDVPLPPAPPTMIAPAPPGADLGASKDNGAAVVGDGAQTPDEPVAPE
jgi:hypothetical protein